MYQQGSYKIHTFSTSVKSEVKRLNAQLELFWVKELKNYRMFGLRDGMKILECGSGPGYLMGKILDNLPNAFITGVEIDPYLVNIAKKHLKKKGLHNYDIFQQSITSMEFDDNSFDFVITRLVLEHLHNPLDAVREIYRVLKPAGKAVFIDNDFEIHLKTYPDIPELNELYKAYCSSKIAEGGNPKIGRELPGILKRGGFSNVDLEIVSAHSEVIGDEIFLKSEGSGIPSQLVKDGYLSRDIFDNIANKWFESLHKENHAIFRQLFMAVGEKAAQGKNENVVSASQKKHKTMPQIALDDIYTAMPAERRRLLEKYLRKQIADSLKIPDHAVDLTIPIIDLGFDSLMAVEITNRIKSDLIITISVATFFEGYAINDIVKLLCDNLSKVGPPDTTQLSKQKGQNLNIVLENKNERKMLNWNVSEDWEEGEI